MRYLRGGDKREKLKDFFFHFLENAVETLSTVNMVYKLQFVFEFLSFLFSFCC